MALPTASAEGPVSWRTTIQADLIDDNTACKNLHPSYHVARWFRRIGRNGGLKGNPVRRTHQGATPGLCPQL